MRSPRLLSTLFAIALVFANAVCACAVDNLASTSDAAMSDPHALHGAAGTPHAGGVDVPAPCAHADCDGCGDRADDCLSDSLQFGSLEREARLNTSQIVDDLSTGVALFYAFLLPPDGPPGAIVARGLSPPGGSADTPILRKDRLTL